MWRKLFSGWFGGPKAIQFESPRGRCIVDGRAIELGAEYLSVASAVELSVTAVFPRWVSPDKLQFRVLGAAREPVHGNTWPVATSARRGRTVDFTITCPPLAARERSLVLQVFSGDTVLGEFPFHQIVGEQLMAELRTTQCTVHALVAGRRQQAELLHPAVDNIEIDVEIALTQPAHRALFNQLAFRLQASLLPLDGERLVLGSWPTTLTFTKNTFRWKIPVSPSNLPVLRHLAIMLHIGRQPLGEARFQTCTTEAYHAAVLPTLAQRLVVQSAVIAVIDHRDRTVSTTEIVDDFKAFAVEVPVELDAPDILLPAVACPLMVALVREGDATPMKSWTCTPAVPVGRSCRVSVRPSLVGVFPPAAGAYRLEITVGGRALPPWHFTLRTRAEIREETITRVLASVELANLRLLVRRDREPLATDTVFAGDELVGPAFTVNATGCSEDVSSVRLDAEMVLARNDGVEMRRQSFALSIRDGANVFDGVRSLEHALHGPLAPGSYRLRVTRAGQRWMELQFAVLSRQAAKEFTRNRIVDTLQVDEVSVTALYGAQLVPGPLVVDCADGVVISFRVSAKGFNSLLPSLATEARISVVREDRRSSTVARVPLAIAAQRPTEQALTVRVRGTSLAARPRRHRLTLFVDERELATVEFEVVAAADAVAQLAAQISLHADGGDGQFREAPPSLDLSVHRSIRTHFALQCPFLVPNLTVAVSLVISEGRRIVTQLDMSVPLDRREIPLRPKPVTLAQFCRNSRRSTRKFTVAIYVAEECKATREFIVICLAQLTDVEGQLHRNADQIPTDRAAYEEIMAGLSN